MPGFDALYKQTVTLFNRVVDQDGDIIWYPRVLKGVHLITDQTAVWNSYGGQRSDNIRLHVRYSGSQDNPIIIGKKYVTPKEWKRLESVEGFITFGYGNEDDFDFFIEGVYEAGGAVNDSEFPRSGFYNYMNKQYDKVFAITQVSKYNLIPHFEIMAR